MAHVTIREAAASLGVSEPTIRRRMRNGDLEHGKDEQGRVWVEIVAPTSLRGAAPAPDHDVIGPATRQLIDELSAERDRWVAEAAAKQEIIDILVQQAENYQVLLYEAQAQVKRLSSPPERPPLLMERVDLPDARLEAQAPALQPEPWPDHETEPPEVSIDATEVAPAPAPPTPRRGGWWRR